MDHSLDVPELAAGDGFVLRPWRLSDLDLVREVSEDDYIPLITTVPCPYSEAEGVAFVERQWGRAAGGSGFPFVIARRSDGRPVGNVGLWLRDLGQGRASLGYWIAKSARGQGAAAAALRAVTVWALQDQRIARLELHVEPWNTASIRTAERVGFRREGLLRSWQQVGEERRDMFMYAMVDGDTR
ncbi:GNAT family N-acetyltransferase [Streptomyces sp. NPDC059466]|uniref:GNAT family N-acetyltransferase n=1 Tax=unclassified Streptomyces TaxID=2593676 RepID=UPI00368A1347